MYVGNKPKFRCARILNDWKKNNGRNNAMKTTDSSFKNLTWRCEKNLLKTLERAHLNVSNVRPRAEDDGETTVVRPSMVLLGENVKRAPTDGCTMFPSVTPILGRVVKIRVVVVDTDRSTGGGGGGLRVPPPPLRRIVLGPTSARGCVLVVSVRVGEGRAPGFITATRTRPDGHSAVRFPNRQTCLVIATATAAAVHSLCSVCRWRPSVVSHTHIFRAPAVCDKHSPCSPTIVAGTSAAPWPWKSKTWNRYWWTSKTTTKVTRTTPIPPWPPPSPLRPPLRAAKNVNNGRPTTTVRTPPPTVRWHRRRRRRRRLLPRRASRTIRS